MIVRSMTGYASVSRAAGNRELTVSLKSVNHRALDLHFHLGVEFEAFEESFRAAIKRRVARGHIDLRISVTRALEGPSMALNRDLLESYLAAHKQAAAEYGLRSEPDLNSALRVPGMFEPAPGLVGGEELAATLLEALEAALIELDLSRSREGAEIDNVLRARNQSIHEGIAKLVRLREGAGAAFQERLNRRLEILLAGIPLDPQRLALEATLLADRSDIGEELDRLSIHARQLAEILDKGGEIGKKLDFLLQEMNRETNTVLSKTNGAGEAALEITNVALSIRSDVEKIREQALNLE